MDQAMMRIAETAPIWISILFGIAATYYFVQAAKESERECKARGGHQVATYKSTLCVSADGRILDDE